MTCSDMFAQHITMADGTPGVRMYEYERIRGTAYGFDAWLPEGSRMLFVRPRIENTTDHEVWTYWWSNFAVPYSDNMRIVVPAKKTFVNYADNNHYHRGLVCTLRRHPPKTHRHHRPGCAASDGGEGVPPGEIGFQDAIK